MSSYSPPPIVSNGVLWFFYEGLGSGFPPQRLRVGVQCTSRESERHLTRDDSSRPLLILRAGDANRKKEKLSEKSGIIEKANVTLRCLLRISWKIQIYVNPRNWISWKKCWCVFDFLYSTPTSKNLTWPGIRDILLRNSFTHEAPSLSINCRNATVTSGG